MRRLWGALLLVALAIPASLSLPSARVVAGASCAMSCGHGDESSCCCAAGADASFRRCSDDDGFVSVPSAKSALPPSDRAVAAPSLSGWFPSVAGLFALRFRPERPDPVPKPLS